MPWCQARRELAGQGIGGWVAEGLAWSGRIPQFCGMPDTHLGHITLALLNTRVLVGR